MSDPFSDCTRRCGELAEKLQRAEELLASTRAQTESFLRRALRAEAMLNTEEHAIVEAFRALKAAGRGEGPYHIVDSETWVRLVGHEEWSGA